MTLNRNPTNFFAETEQVAFHAGHLVRGIEVTDDPLMQARLFSYLDTQLTRLGGPNFSQIPINRPRRRRSTTTTATASCSRRSTPGARRTCRTRVGGGCPFLATRRGRRLRARAAAGRRRRRRASGRPTTSTRQATLFWHSMTEVEQDHIVDAFTFELGKVDVPAVVDRMLMRLALDRRRACARVARRPRPAGRPTSAAARRRRRPSPALCDDRRTSYPVDGRVVHILADRRRRPRRHPCAEGRAARRRRVRRHVVAPHKGAIAGRRRRGDELTVDRSFHTASSAEADAVVIAAGAALSDIPAVVTYVQEAYRHHKTIGGWGDATELLAAAGIDIDEPGVEVTDRATKATARAITRALSQHRHWDRATVGGMS